MTIIPCLALLAASTSRASRFISASAVMRSMPIRSMSSFKHASGSTSAGTAMSISSGGWRDGVSRKFREAYRKIPRLVQEDGLSQEKH